MAGPSRPLVLPEGDSPPVDFQVFAGATCSRRYLLEGFERVSWSCEVSDGYDVVLSARICCAGLQRDSERGREVTERERSGDFEGYLDLSKEHAGWLAELGAGPSTVSGPSSTGAARGGSAVLSLEFDNTYSLFTPKTVVLRMSKLAGAAPRVRCYDDAIASCEAGRQWGRTLQLLDRMRDVGVAPAASSYCAAMSVCKAARQWRASLRLLDDMRRDGLRPGAAAYGIAIDACESEGLVDTALRLVDEMPSPEEDSAAPADREAELESVRWLRAALDEALERCPAPAHQVRCHLAAAKASLQAYASAQERDCL